MFAGSEPGPVFTMFEDEEAKNSIVPRTHLGFACSDRWL